VCTPIVCGNGIPQPGEQCDDGNMDDNDCCHNDCTAAPPGTMMPQVNAVLSGR
jgi:cysteine-rich repeat protein